MHGRLSDDEIEKVKSRYSELVDPKTRRRVSLDRLDERSLKRVCFDTVFIKSFIKEELEEILKADKGSRR